MPMLPGEDQLIPYGEDTSVSITRSQPQEAQSNGVESVEAIVENGRVVGAKLMHKCIKTTRYTLRNNSTDRKVEKLYVDHTAGTQHGGFVITTTERRVKAVTG